ncbi:MAG: CGNR zinc finger domain-containing protein [Thermomicrobiales bacterium]
MLDSTVVPVRPNGPDSKRPAAPGELALVQAFINAIDREEGIEEWPTTAHLERWLVDRGLIDPDGAPLVDADLARAIAMREALRDLIAWSNGDRTGTSSLERLDGAAGERARTLRVEIDDGGALVLVPVAMGLDGAFARLLATVYRAQADGTWDRMRLCRNPDCRWAFYDASKNRSSVWCDMAMCGSRHKARTYRARHRGGGGRESER